jgi:hypothetical protein
MLTSLRDEVSEVLRKEFESPKNRRSRRGSRRSRIPRNSSLPNSRSQSVPANPEQAALRQRARSSSRGSRRSRSASPRLTTIAAGWSSGVPGTQLCPACRHCGTRRRKSPSSAGARSQSCIGSPRLHGARNRKLQRITSAGVCATDARTGGAEQRSPLTQGSIVANFVKHNFHHGLERQYIVKPKFTNA